MCVCVIVKFLKCVEGTLKFRCQTKLSFAQPAASPIMNGNLSSSSENGQVCSLIEKTTPKIVI